MADAGEALRNPLLEVSGLTKLYHGVAAVRDMSLSIGVAEVHGLIGENGAGKSTLCKMIAGVVPPSAGQIVLNGKPARFDSVAAARKAGVGMVFQETSLVPSMSVAQNLFLGEEAALNRLRGTSIAAQQFLQTLNFSVDPQALVSELGAAHKQMVEIARAVRQKAQLIIFDEPTATLTPEEKRHFFALVRRLRSRGVSVVFISHALEEVLSLADRITVMRDGLRIATRPASLFTRADLIQAMVGRDVSDTVYGSRDRAATRSPGPLVLSVQNLSMGRLVRNNSFSVYAGQITGLFGLIGSGRTETAKVVTGVTKRDFFRGGVIEFEGRRVRYRTPRAAVRDGIVYVTEDRKAEGFLDGVSIGENIYAGAVSGARLPPLLVNAALLKRLAREWIGKLAIRSVGSSARVVELSGGNQQKVVLAKALVQKPRLIFVDEPTRGIDVGAIAEIHAILRTLADEGVAVVVISSYLPEVISLSDRVLVCRQGRVVEEFTAQSATETDIMYAAVH